MAVLLGDENVQHSGLATEPLFFDLDLTPHSVFEQALPTGHNALVYAVQIGEKGSTLRLPTQAAGMLSAGEQIRIETVEGARAILLAARPLNEPVVQQGPFVMNTPEEIEQAISDYRNGTLTD